MADYICPAEPEITHCYNAAKVRELIRQSRDDALEEAANEIIANGYALHAGQVIRSLKDKQP